MPLDSLFKAFPFKKRRHAAHTGIRLAVVGAGRMGQYHLRHLANRVRANLVAVVDSDSKRASEAARRFGLAAHSSLTNIIGQIDAAIVATPTASHFAIAQPLLAAGISCLIEKPIASTPEEAKALIDIAKKSGVVLQVGHIERFNPAILEAARHIQAPQFIEVSRLGPYDPRVAGIGVVMDLMIHDLDIVQFLVDEPVDRIEAFGAKVLSSQEDIAKVRLLFRGGCVADLSASRISLERYRRIRVFQKNAYLSIDYAAPHLKIYRKRSEVVRSLTDIVIEKPRLAKRDALAAELDHFIDCAQRRCTPMVSGEHGLSALELAARVLDQLQVHG